MRAAALSAFGGPEVLRVVDMPKPAIGPEEILIRVRAAGINRADIMQRRGLYPMPPGVSDQVPGLELSGDVEAVGAAVRTHRPGDRVIALVAEGAYAECARADAGLAVPLPSSMDYQAGAAVIEVFCTAGETVFELGRLQPGETFLCHAAASGVGTAAIQMAKYAGARVIATAGSQGKVEAALGLGADFGVNYRSPDWAEDIFRFTKGEGVDVILCAVGAEFLSRNFLLLRDKGRQVQVGSLGGHLAELDFRPMFRKRLQLLGFTLRAQPLAEKRQVVRRFAERWLPLLASGAIKPVIHAALPLAEAGRAHAMMERNENVGKILLTMD